MKALLASLGNDRRLSFRILSPRAIVINILVAAAAFHASYLVDGAAALMLVFLLCVVHLTRVRTSRQAMYSGLVLGLGIYAPHLSFFWTIFGPAAIGLWLVLSFWLGLFLVTARECRMRFKPAAATLLLPVLWLGMEFFRSELYYLRFTWLTPGFAFSERPLLPGLVGVYGTGFVLMCVASALSLLTIKRQFITAGLTVALLTYALDRPEAHSAASVTEMHQLPVAGVQMEFPSERLVELALNAMRKEAPQAELFVLSEYTFDGPVPRRVREWCREHRKYLIAGGKEPVDSVEEFQNTAYVVGPDGEVVFKQGKAVPIQFFKDGLAASKQELWNSPWGKIGICICYDLSYSRVVDELVRQGAQALIVPTMDVEDWGEYQHRLHARIARLRAAEHGLAIFRIASSGVSQHVSSQGTVLGTIPFAKSEGQLSGTLGLVQAGRLPPDRVAAWIATAISAMVMVLFGVAKGYRLVTRNPNTEARNPKESRNPKPEVGAPRGCDESESG